MQKRPYKEAILPRVSDCGVAMPAYCMCVSECGAAAGAGLCCCLRHVRTARLTSPGFSRGQTQRPFYPPQYVAGNFVAAAILYQAADARPPISFRARRTDK